MTSLLGLHWLREHADNNRDLRHIEAMQYPSIKLFKNVWDNRETSAAILSVLPRNSYILARDHALSEQKEQMWSKPVEHGIYHANEWANKVKSGVYTLPLDRTFFLGINEPNADSGDRNAIDLYTEAFLERLRVHGLRGGGFNFSTGHPRTVDGTPNTQPDYGVFERSHQAIVRGRHIGVLHIYGTGAVPCAPGHFDRLKACTWQDVEWVVGEFGVDEHVIGGGEHAGFHKYFKDRLNDYCGWLDTAIMGVNDPRIHSYQVFTHDFSHPWSSFDIRPIRDALERYEWQHIRQQPSKPPVTTPSVPAGKTAKLYVNVRDGANLRTSPGGGDVLIAVPFTTIVEVSGYANGTDGWTWARSRYEGYTGYIRGDLLSVTQLQPTPDLELPPPPAPQSGGILDPLVLEAIVLTESNGSGFHNLRLKIRLEGHLLTGPTWGNPSVFTRHFSRDTQNKLLEYFRRSEGEPWIMYHESQEMEWQAFEFARSLDAAAALRCTSMGAGQVMGFNARRVGYQSPLAMFEAFQRGEIPQMMAVVNYCLSDAELTAAIARKDWDEIVRRYNGKGLEHIYTPRLLANYKKVGGK